MSSGIAPSEAARLLTPAEVAARWQLPVSAVYRLTRADKLPTVRLGRYYRYTVAAIERFEADGGSAADE